jgi:DNA-binding MarR family transcriptional regulator
MTLDEDTLSACFGRIWPVHNDAFCELLVTLRRHFGGDLDRMLVLAVIGSRTLSGGRIDDLWPAAINLQSIADYSGIPRETVRRKLRDLERLGWITRCDKGYLVATRRAAEDLEPATRATMRYLLAVIGAWREGRTCVSPSS